MMSNINQVKQLREETEAPVNECLKALSEAKGDREKAKEILRKWGKTLAAKKVEREVKEGIIDVYLHPNKKVGVILELRCESDFVAKNEDFQKLAHELCLQIAAMDPENQDLFLSQPWIKDETKKIKDLLTEHIAKLGENIVVRSFSRLSVRKP